MAVLKMGTAVGLAISLVYLASTTFFAVYMFKSDHAYTITRRSQFWRWSALFDIFENLERYPTHAGLTLAVNTETGCGLPDAPSDGNITHVLPQQPSDGNITHGLPPGLSPDGYITPGLCTCVADVVDQWFQQGSVTYPNSTYSPIEPLVACSAQRGYWTLHEMCQVNVFAPLFFVSVICILSVMQTIYGNTRTLWASVTALVLGTVLVLVQNARGNWPFALLFGVYGYLSLYLTPRLLPSGVDRSVTLGVNMLLAEFFLLPVTGFYTFVQNNAHDVVFLYAQSVLLWLLAYSALRILLTHHIQYLKPSADEDNNRPTTAPYACDRRFFFEMQVVNWFFSFGLLVSLCTSIGMYWIGSAGMPLNAEVCGLLIVRGVVCLLQLPGRPETAGLLPEFLTLFVVNILLFAFVSVEHM